MLPFTMGPCMGPLHGYMCKSSSPSSTNTRHCQPKKRKGSKQASTTILVQKSPSYIIYLCMYVFAPASWDGGMLQFMPP
jgi:hypothetical protein